MLHSVLGGAKLKGMSSELDSLSPHRDLQERRRALVPRGTALQSMNLLATLKLHGYEPMAQQLEIIAEAWFHYKRATAIVEAATPADMLTMKYQLAREDMFKFLVLLKSANAEILNYAYPKKKSVQFVDESGKNPFETFADMVRSMGQSADEKV